MDYRTYMLVDQANRCGTYDCLKGCCGTGNMRNIWVLMRTVSEADLPELERLLCGCAVSTASASTAAANPKAPANQSTVPGTNIPATGTCADALTEWACESSHVAILTGIDTGLTAAAVYARTSPLIAKILAAISIFVSDMIAACRDDEPSWTATFIAKACGLNSWIDEALGKGEEVSVISEILLKIKDTLTLSGVIAAKCCTGQAVATGVWPDLGGQSTTTITPAGATNNQRYSKQ